MKKTIFFVLCATVIYIASLFVTGYNFCFDNHAIQIPLVQHLVDPALFPLDTFVGTLSKYVSVVWYGVAFLNHFFSLPHILFVLFLIERFLILLSVGVLATAFYPNSRLASLGAMALFALAPTPILGGGTLVVPYFEQTGFSLPFFILAIAAFYRNKPILWAMLLGIGFNCNFMYGVYALVYCSALFWGDKYYIHFNRKWLLAFCVLVCLMTPTFIQIYQSFAVVSVGQNEFLLRVLKTRLPHHLVPLTWYPKSFVMFILFSCLPLSLLWSKRWHAVEQRMFKWTVVFFAISLLWLFLAFVSAYLVHIPALLIIHPVRGVDIWFCFACVMMMSFFANELENSSEPTQFSLLLFYAILIFFSPFPASIMILGILWLKTDFIWSRVLARANVFRVCLMLVFIVTTIGVVSVVKRSSGSCRFSEALVGQPPRTLREAAEWVRNNTSRDAYFLVNPNLDKFRPLAERSVFITWKDGAAALWDRSFAYIWTQRFSALKMNVDESWQTNDVTATIDLYYEQLNDADVSVLKKIHGFNYWLVSRSHVSNFSVVFQNEDYKIVSLQ